MKRFAAIAVFVGLVLTALAFHAPRIVTADNPPRYKVEMATNPTGDSLEKLLNKRASEGWYLLTATTEGGGTTEYVFTNVSPQH